MDLGQPDLELITSGRAYGLHPGFPRGCQSKFLMGRLSGSCHYLRLHPLHIPPKMTVQSVTNVCTSLPVRMRLKLGQKCVSIGCSVQIDPLHSFTIDDIELKCKHHFHWSWLVLKILSEIIANITHN